MDPDKYQQAWRAESSQTRVTVDADLLLKAVQRNQQEIRAAIFFDDFTEIGTSLLMLPVWIYMGVTTASPWTWYLMAPSYLWIIGFTLVVGARHKRKPSESSDPLLTSVNGSLALVEHQIWRCRNVLWWYVLPIAIPLLAFTTQVSWIKSRDWLDALSDVNAFIFVFLVALSYFIYWLNQRVVRTQYEPRRQELLTLLASLRDETTSKVTGEYPILMSANRVECSRRRMFVASLCFVAVILILIAGIIFLVSTHAHPERSPFAAVRWQQSQPEVKVGDEWFKLVSLDDLPAAEIVAFSQRTYGNQWQKRFEEDLVEVLTRMGHEPKDTVQLVVSPLGFSTTRTLEDVPMTSANRQAIRDAALARERDEQQAAPPGTVDAAHKSQR